MASEELDQRNSTTLPLGYYLKHSKISYHKSFLRTRNKFQTKLWSSQINQDAKEVYGLTWLAHMVELVQNANLCIFVQAANCV